MLDKSDLKAIGNLIKTGNDSVKQELRQEISGVKQELKADLSKQLKKEISPLKRDIKKIKTDIETVISFFDDEQLKLQKRVIRVETHLGLSPTTSL